MGWSESSYSGVHRLYYRRKVSLGRSIAAAEILYEAWQLVGFSVAVLVALWPNILKMNTWGSKHNFHFLVELSLIDIVQLLYNKIDTWGSKKNFLFHWLILSSFNKTVPKNETVPRNGHIFPLCSPSLLFPHSQTKRSSLILWYLILEDKKKSIFSLINILPSFDNDCARPPF